MMRKKLMGILLSAALAITSIPVSAQDAVKEPAVGLETIAVQSEKQEKAAPESKAQEKTEEAQTEAKEKAAEVQTEAEKETVKETDPQTEKETVKETEPQTEKQSESQTEKETQKPSETGEPETVSEKDTESESETAQASETESETETEKETQSEADIAAQALKQLRAASGSSDAGGSSVSETAKFVPGTYTVTANLYVPGELNTILGLNAYLTNPNNPVGIKEDNGEISNTAPTTPVTANASITIGEDGVTKTLTIPVKNPVFTLQRISSGSNVTIVDSSRNSNSYGNYTGRITSLTVTLGDNSGEYIFSNCLEYPTILEQDWNVPLYLAVDLASIPGDTTVKIESGDGSTWEAGSPDSLSFIAAETFDKMKGVQVDGADLASQDYSAFAYNGMTYVDLNTAYLSGLGSGLHRVTILFADGFSANASFTIKKEEESGEDTTNELAGKNLAPGTYQVSANLYLPGELNTQLPGTTAYLTNPNNPLGIGGHNGLPVEPVSDNATLVVGKDGTKTVIVDVVNPVFTLQKITSGKNITVKASVRDKETYTGVSQTASRTGRITKLFLVLKDNKGIYQFGDCTEFPTLLETDWKVPLQLSVDFIKAKKTSDSTDVTIPADAEHGNNGGESEDNSETGSETESESNRNTENTDPNAGDGTLKPGTYTVAANIWIDKASSGLPLNPHLTSSVFPPKDPVSNNAKVTIDKNGEATVKVPIVIQSKVMSIKSISGLNIVDSSSSGGYLSSITVDLGKVTNPNAVITKGCTVSLDLGELAQTIAHKEKAQVWGATFQVNFSGIPSGGSGGGNVDVNSLLAQAENNGQSEKGTNIRIGMREDIYSAPYFPMMEEHKNDTEIKETETDTAAASSAANTTSGQTSITPTEVKNSYLFSIEKLEDSEENKDLTEEERSEALSEQYLKHFTDGTYDLILATPQEAEKLYQSEEMKGKFVVLAMNTYEKNSDGQSVEAESTDSQTDGTEALVGIDAPDGSVNEDGEEVRLLLAAKSFVEKHQTAVTDILSKVKASASDAVKEPEKAAVSMVSLGMGTDSASVQQLLKENKAELLTGTELQEAVDALAEDEDLTDLKSEGLCYVPSASAKSSKVQTTPETEGSETEETEKINITDADSLSAALDAALAKKDESETEGTADLNISNSSGLDLEAEKAAAESLEPGTYTASVNLYLPGERNTQLPGTTAYMTNPDNPLGIGDHEGLPIVPAEANGTLVVAEDGTKTVTFDIVNPVFTLQKISAPENSQILAGVRDEERYEGTNGVGVDGRITQLVIQLGDDSALYPFDDCAEFPTLLETDWYVPLELSVEFTSAEKVSDSTEVTLPEDTAGVATE